MTIEARIAAYLDGELDRRAAAEVEAALVDPAAAGLLAEELMLRQLLATMPPDSAPVELIARLEDTLGVGSSPMAWARQRLRAALPEPRRAVRGPALGVKAFAAARVGVAGARGAATGLSTVRGAATGLSTVRNTLTTAAELAAPLLRPPKPKPLWRRTVSYLWRARP